MFTSLDHAVWILEVETEENAAIYLCYDHTPTEFEFAVLQKATHKKFGDVSIRILSKKEVIAAKLGLNPYEFERRSRSRLPLAKNKKRDVVN